jgi:hypothetical protein
MNASPRPGTPQEIVPSSESVAGEEDPGASIDPTASRPGDEAPPGTPGTGEGICRECGGRGVTSAGESCPTCSGTGRVTVGIGGA